MNSAHKHVSLSFCCHHRPKSHPPTDQIYSVVMDCRAWTPPSREYVVELDIRWRKTINSLDTELRFTSQSDTWFYSFHHFSLYIVNPSTTDHLSTQSSVVGPLPQMMMSIHIFSMNVDIYHRVFLLVSVSFIVRPSFSSACKWMVWCGRDMKDTRRRKEGDWYWCPNDVHSQMSRGTRRTNSTSSPLSLCQVDPLRTTTTWIAV